jgi:hypothetical protein
MRFSFCIPPLSILAKQSSNRCLFDYCELAPLRGVRKEGHCALNGMTGTATPGRARAALLAGRQLLAHARSRPKPATPGLGRGGDSRTGTPTHVRSRRLLCTCGAGTPGHVRGGDSRRGTPTHVRNRSADLCCARRAAVRHRGRHQVESARPAPRGVGWPTAAAVSSRAAARRPPAASLLCGSASRAGARRARPGRARGGRSPTSLRN